MSHDRLYFYSKSKDVFPGKGTHEFVSDPSQYCDLASIPQWRQVLSNFYVCPFVYQCRTYRTLEHLFQGKKMELVHPEAGFVFTLDSGSEIGRGDGLVARKNRMFIKLTEAQLAEWDRTKHTVMYEGAKAKFEQCDLGRKVLKATKNAELWHIIMRSQPMHVEYLEQIREEI